MKEKDMKELAGNIIIEQDEILLIFDEDLGYWRIPRDKVKQSESPSKAAKRGLRNDLNISGEIKDTFYTGEFLKNSELILWHSYRTNLAEEEDKTGIEQSDDTQWFKTGELQNKDISPGLKLILPGLRKID